MSTATTPQSQRKRALDALERRFAAAKAELHHQQQQQQQQQPKKKVKTVITQQPGHHSFSPASCSTSIKSVPIEKDAEDNDPTYSRLSHAANDNLLATIEKFSGKRGGIVDKVLHDLLQHGDSAQKYMQGSRSMKIDNHILLDNFVQGRSSSEGSYVKALKAQSKRSKKHMSMKQHKKSGSFVLPQDQRKFHIFKLMHEMWKDYIMQLIKVSGKNQLGQCLLNADLHGAIISVVECKINSLAGVSGIMIRETAETFGIITPEDKFRVVPKKASVFIFQVDCWKITLLGEKLASRNIGL